MTDIAEKPDVAPPLASAARRAQVARRLKKRYAAEARFRFLGLLAVSVAIAFLVLLVGTQLIQGVPAFLASKLEISVTLDPAKIDPDGTGDPKVIGDANYRDLLLSALQTRFPEAQDRRQRRDLLGLVSTNATYDLRDMVLAEPALIGQTVTISVYTDDVVDLYRKGKIEVGDPDAKLSDFQVQALAQLEADGALYTTFNSALFVNSASREPESAGLLGAVVGSLLTLVVTLGIAFPLGVAAAVYLEEFAPKNRWTDLIEVNINNLAAVPSIVFGLLGLALFLNLFGMPRSAPLVGGLVLSLQALPIIIIAGRAAIKAVPPSIREAALGMGASRIQTVSHHILPLSMPGMLTGAILGMAHALGETAPLLMIGMVAFVADVPAGFTSPATVLPVQIYLWADFPERAFVDRTSAAILTLLVFLLLMNATAIYLRKKFERKW